MRSPRALRALVRVERRQLCRHPGRSSLIVLLIAVPVAALVGGSSLHHITAPTPEEQRTAAMGQATFRVDAVSEADLGPVLAQFPEATRWTSFAVGTAEVRVPGRRLRGRTYSFAPADLETGGLAEGMLRTGEGRLPATAGEVALSPVLRRGLEVELGATVRVDATDCRVTGIVFEPEDLDLPVVLLPAAAAAGAGLRSLLAEVPADAAQRTFTRLQSGGCRVSRRSEQGGDDGFESLAILVLGSFGFFEAALVIAAAFAVTLRRRQRELGLLGSCGASARGMHASLLLSAAALAVLGGVLGVAIGAGAVAAVHPWLDGWNHRLNGPFELSRVHLASALLLALVTSTLAATLPARHATRLPLRVALSGRRPVASTSLRGLTLGLILQALGLAIAVGFAQQRNGALAISLGSILVLMGLGASSPWLLGWLARYAAPLPLAWRLAVRDSGRFRSRHGPVVTAVLAGMALSISVATLLASVERSMAEILARNPPLLRQDQLLVEGPGAEDVAAALAAALPAVSISPLQALHAHGLPVLASYHSADAEPRVASAGWVALGDAELLQTLGIDRGADALKQGHVLVLVGPQEIPPGPERGKLEITIDGELMAESPPFTLVPRSERVAAPGFIAAPTALGGGGQGMGPPPGFALTPHLVRLNAPVQSDQVRLAQQIAARTPGMSIDADRLHQRPTTLFRRALLLICFFTGLVIVAVATALSSVESAADARVLHTVGAAPRLLRGHVAARSGYLAFLGCALAVPAGLLPAVGLIRLSNFTLPFTVPWTEILVTVLGLPAMAYGGSWCFVLLRQRAAMLRLRARSSSLEFKMPLALTVLVLLALPPTASAAATGSTAALTRRDADRESVLDARADAIIEAQIQLEETLEAFGGLEEVYSLARPLHDEILRDVRSQPGMLSKGKFLHNPGIIAMACERFRDPDLGDHDPVRVIIDFDGLLKERNIDLIVVPVPAKVELYHDDFEASVPAGLPVCPGRLDAMLALLEADVEVVDVLPVLQAAKADAAEPLYELHGHHLSGYGVKLAGELVAGRLARYAFSDADPERLEEVRRSSTERVDRGVPMKIWQILDRESGEPYLHEDDRPVVVIGDSQAFAYFTASWASHIAQEIGTPISDLSESNGGPTAHQKLARLGNARLDRRRVVIWIFTAVSLLDNDGGWDSTELYAEADPMEDPKLTQVRQVLAQWERQKNGVNRERASVPAENIDRIGRELLNMRQFDLAEQLFRAGLEMHPGSELLQTGLTEAEAASKP